MIIETEMYVHGSKEASWELGVGLGLTGEPLQMFRYAGEEFKLGLEVDTETGLARVVSIDGRKVDD